MFICLYACLDCEEWWPEVFDEITYDLCDRCKMKAYPRVMFYEGHSPLLDEFLYDRRHPQLKLFGDDSA